ncbi:hypothetical protein C900_03498 [Fulvivirga imtechensis AK7]|uniref:OmpA-like domain-containing protein n=1 Tax=Fulvivirga imtechensis AK7 TaxID=1237149 RepID=L8JPG0_9BACT|nr:PD40 domain-containing protein [Fulvivirga imtechensis]ELR70725.1 hypothetical protein C900_03498 [Fulvivirga imtechensis AK7]
MSRITRTSVFVLISLIGFVNIQAQDELRKLPSNINRASINLYAPFISGDGQTLVYLSDYTDDGHHSMRWTTKKTVSTWNDELEITKLINRPTLNYRGGYSLSFDGNMLLFTSRKSGLGGFDLWYSNRRGNDWEAPGNFGMPVNSRENEGAPMLSPDGEYLYFMRCEKMSEYGGASGCRILVSKKTYNGWGEPKELPANINTGNSQTPRILADGETMIFASDKFGGKGGLDLFMTSRMGETWTDPIPMEFINTEKDDQFVSIPAKGRYLFAAKQGTRNSELVQILIPEDFQPKKVMRIQGTVTGASEVPLNANLTVFNINERDRLWNEKTGPKGEFAIVLKEGAAYDVAVDLDDPSYMYFSKIYNLKEEIGARDKEILKIQLMPIQKGAVYELPITFESNSSEIDDISTFELRRISDLLRKNPYMAIEIAVHQNSYREDSIQSSPDLTEVVIDSIFSQVERPILSRDSLETSYDSMAGDDVDSLEMVDYDEELVADTADVVYEIIEQLEIRYTYHNDRTQKQSEAIKAYLVGRGVEESRIWLKISRSEKIASVDESEEVNTENVQVKLKVTSF